MLGGADHGMPFRGGEFGDGAWGGHVQAKQAEQMVDL